MKVTTEYSPFDLHKGKCRSCGKRKLILNEDVSVKDANKCPDCIEDDKFFEMTSK